MHCARCYFFESSVGDDVCNRCGRAYLPEANVYLGLMVFVTGTVAWTLRHLLTGYLTPFVRPTLGLGAWVTWPVSIVESPAWGLVLGAWLAMLAVAPLITGMLYGKRGGWLLTMVVAALGPSLWMAAAIALGVWIAAGYTLRLSSKLSSALLGLVPAAAYWFVATALTDFGAAEAPATAASAMETGARALAPALRSLAWVPSVMAVVVAAGVVAAIVGIGWADRWHVRWPGAALAVLTAAPLLALVAFVGIDEVRFGMTLAPGPAIGPWDAPETPLADRMRGFLTRYPDSPRAPEVRARLAALVGQESADLSRGPDREALDLWREILRRHPTSPPAVDARLNLGDAEARQGLFDAARDFFTQAAAMAAAPAATGEESPLATFRPMRDFFTIGRALRDHADEEHLAGLRRDLLARLALLADNRTAAPENTRALALYFAALARKGSSAYHDALVAARDADPKGALADNIAYDLALFEADDAKRAEQLAAVVAAHPGTDGAMLARLKAAQTLIALAASRPGALREARENLLAVRKDLEARQARNALDPYVTWLADRVEKELIYVQAQLRTPAVESQSP
jgi:MFS family permease